MPFYDSSEGKRRAREIWYAHAEGNVLMLSAPDLTDADALAAMPQVRSIITPEINPKVMEQKLQAMERLTEPRNLKISLVSGDYLDWFMSNMNTFILDTQNGWCRHTEMAIRSVCHFTEGIEKKLFLTVSKYNGSWRFHPGERKSELFNAKYRSFDRVKLALQNTIVLEKCIPIPIVEGCFSYVGTPQNKGSQPVMFHYAYRIRKEI
jgi:hypothetical protein